MKLIACLVLTVAFVFAAASTRADDPPKKGQLPANWSKLGLSDKQKAEIYTIEAKYKSDIDALQKQISALREKERSEMMAVLTDAQKARLKEILLEKAGDKPEKKGDGK